MRAKIVGLIPRPESYCQTSHCGCAHNPFLWRFFGTDFYYVEVPKCSSTSIKQSLGATIVGIDFLSPILRGERLLGIKILGRGVPNTLKLGVRKRLSCLWNYLTKKKMFLLPEFRPASQILLAKPESRFFCPIRVENDRINSAIRMFWTSTDQLRIRQRDQIWPMEDIRLMASKGQINLSKNFIQERKHEIAVANHHFASLENHLTLIGLKGRESQLIYLKSDDLHWWERTEPFCNFQHPQFLNSFS